MAHRSEPGEDFQPGVFRCPCGLYADANPTSVKHHARTCLLADPNREAPQHYTQVIQRAVDRQTTFANLENQRANQAQAILLHPNLPGNNVQLQANPNMSNQIRNLIYQMEELYGVPCAESHALYYPQQYLKADRLTAALLKPLKISADNPPFHMTRYNIDADMVRHINFIDGQVTGNIRMALIEVLRPLMAEDAVLPTQPNQYISLEYDVMMDFRDEPLFEIELIPRNTSIDNIARMIASTVMCGLLDLRGAIPQYVAEIRPDRNL